MNFRDARDWGRIVAAYGMVLAVVSGLTGCSCFDQGAFTRHPADPEVTLLYSCDSGRSGELNKAKPVMPHDTRSISTSANEVLFFVVDVDYEPAGAGGHSKLYYVLGGEPGTIGKATIRGRKVNPTDPAMIKLDSGWLWVSSTPPPNWTGPTTAASNINTPAPPSPGADNWLSWSIITLIRTRWNWAGSEATEFIARLTPTQDVVYAIDDQGMDEATNTWIDASGQKQTIKVPVNYHSARGNSTSPGPIDPTPPGSSHDRFVKYVECRVDAIEANPASGSECDTDHTGCLAISEKE